MRIIAGRLRRRILKAPKGHLTRPTTDRVKESLFNMLQSRLQLEGADILDLFAGTGALGYEAISRGAESVTFVESNPQVMKCCRENATLLNVADACAFFLSDAVTFLKTHAGPAFDAIFADPPYELADLYRLPDLALPHIVPDGVFVLEHDQRHAFDDHPLLDISRAYGRTIVSIFIAES